MPKTIATPARLQVLTLNELKEWCRKKELPYSGTKAELVERLCAYRGGIPLQKLSVSHLRDICEAESLSGAGTRTDLILRLSNVSAGSSSPLPPVIQEKYEHKAETRVRINICIEYSFLILNVDEKADRDQWPDVEACVSEEARSVRPH